MHCIKQITDNLLWVGANDRRLALFEGVYSVPDGVSYNSWLLSDEKTVLFDTVDKAVQERFMENLAEGLNGRPLDYLILQHIEPDHSASVNAVIDKYPQVTLVLNEKSNNFVSQFYNISPAVKKLIVKEGEPLSVGKHKLHFVMAPMVHWPEVMVTYDETSRTLFSADAFGCFGALNGAIFADEVNFSRDYLDEARRYYTNIVGKYGPQVQALLKKASGLAIDMICPLHGFVWRKNLKEIINPYLMWSSYEPEEQGVMIAYASIYGNTENAAEILACRLRDKGIKTVMYDVSVTPDSDIVAAAFKWSHLVFASSTYNAGIFVTMESLINDLTAHNIQNRTVAFIENGTWAATSGKLMRGKFEKCKNINFLGNVSIKSSVKEQNLSEIEALACAIEESFPDKLPKLPNKASAAPVDVNSLWKIPYGLYMISAKDGEKDNGCISNTVSQVTSSPLQISITLNKDSLTHGIIQKTKMFAVSILAESAPFALFEHFGLTSGKSMDKFNNLPPELIGSAVQMDNGLYVLNKFVNAQISAKVTSETDCDTHTIFIAEVIQAKTISDERTATYTHYLTNIKPKPKSANPNQAGYVCKICAYVYKGETLPEDFICPLCKHGVADFEKL